MHNKPKHNKDHSYDLQRKKARCQEHNQTVEKQLMLKGGKKNLDRRRKAKSREDRQLMLTACNLGAQSPAFVKFKQQEMQNDSEMQMPILAH